MASGINIYSFFFRYPKNYSGYLKKNFLYLKHWHINFRYLKKEFQMSEITISDIHNRFLLSEINVYFRISEIVILDIQNNFFGYLK